MTNHIVLALAVSGTNLFAGTWGGGVWRRPLSDTITSVKDHGGLTELPTQFRLEQNYPNPFNPTTTISFSIPTKSFVTLKVYDALGKEVAVLVSGELLAGTYSRQWNASGLPSGVYFYTLQAGSLSETKKLILLR